MLQVCVNCSWGYFWLGLGHVFEDIWYKAKKARSNDIPSRRSPDIFDVVGSADSEIRITTESAITVREQYNID